MYRSLCLNRFVMDDVAFVSYARCVQILRFIHSERRRTRKRCRFWMEYIQFAAHIKQPKKSKKKFPFAFAFAGCEWALKAGR